MQEKNNQSVEATELKNKVKTNKAEKFNDEIVRCFDNFLEDNEKILKANKPSKTKMYISNLMKPLVLYLIFLIGFVFMYCFPSEGLTREDSVFFIIFVTAFFVLIELLIFLFSAMYLRHTYFAITNKRILVLTGIFGTELKSLEISSIGSINVKMDFFDRIMNKKTGSIKIVSSIVPMNTAPEIITLANIFNANLVCEEIKLQIKKIENGKK